MTMKTKKGKSAVAKGKSAVAIRPQPGWRQGGWQPPRKSRKPAPFTAAAPRPPVPAAPIMILPAMFTMVAPFVIPTSDQAPGECVWEFCVVGRIGLFAVAVLQHTGRGFRLRDNETQQGEIWTPGGAR